MDHEKEMPMGLAFQMAMNESALENFTKLSEEEKRQVLESARAVQSKQEMRSIVEDLGKLS